MTNFLSTIQDGSRHEDLLGSLPAAVYVLDSEWCFTAVNEEASRFWNRRPEHLLGCDVWEEFTHLVGSRFHQAHLDAAEKGKATEVEVLAPGTRDRFFRARIAPVSDGLMGLCQDIQEYKRTVEELRREEAHYRRAMQDSGLVAARVDKDLRYVWIYNPHPDFDPETVRGKRDDEIDDNAGTRELMALKRRVLETGQPVQREISFPVSDGLRVYDVRGEPLRDDEGTIVGLTTVSQDATDLKLTQLDARRHEERFAKAFHLNPDAMIISQIEDGRILEVNESCVELFGYERSEMLGESSLMLNMFVDTADRKRAAQRIREEGFVRDFELDIRRKSGEIRRGVLSSVLLEGDIGPVMLTNLRDVTEQVRLRTVIERSEKHFRKVFEASPLPIMVTTLKAGQIVDLNESCLTFLGSSRAETIGHTTTELGLWRTRGELTRTKLVSRLGVEGAVRNQELTVQLPSGEVRQVLGSFELIEEDDEARVLNIFLDITERKRTEDRLMRAVQSAMQDAQWLSRSIMERFVHSGADLPSEEAGASLADLTGREKEILLRIARGWDNARIAEGLGLRPQTVHNYASRIYEKLGVHSRAEVIVWARQRGLVEL